MNWLAIGCFLAVVLVTLAITYVAARRTRSAADFYVAGGRISGTSNGLAIAGDFMSAATLLGMTGLIFHAGFDVAIYAAAPMAGFSILIFVMTDKLKRLGRYTFTDIACARLDERPIRILAATTTLSFSLMYLVVQVVGAGALIQVLFGFPYPVAVVIVTVLMVTYVSLGGMLATTWAQITKAVLLLGGIAGLALLSILALDGSVLESARGNHARPDMLIQPGGLGLSGFSALSLGLGLAFGVAGSPHLLMRFFTVPDAAAARKSAGVALAAIGFVNLLILFVVGWSSIALVGDRFRGADGEIVGGANMVAIHLSQVVGGDAFLGLMSAIAFATILAVVAGLTLAAVSAVSHDLYANAIRRGQASEAEELRVSRLAAVGLGVVMIGLGIAFQGQNLAYLVSLAMAIGASTNFPLLILSMYWRGFTTKGAIAGALTGLVTAISLMILGPAVWVRILGNENAVFSEAYPALYSVSAAFLVMWIVSTSDRSARGDEDRRAFGRMGCTHSGNAIDCRPRSVTG